MTISAVKDSGEAPGELTICYNGKQGLYLKIGAGGQDIRSLWIKIQLRKFRRGLGKIDLKNEVLDDLLRWKRHTIEVMSRMYPNGSDLIHRIENVLNQVQQVDLQTSSLTDSPTRLEYKKRSYDEFLGIVNELSETIKQEGVPADCKLPPGMTTVSTVVGIVATFLTIYFTCFPSEEMGIESAAKHGLATEGQANIALSDFYRKLKAYDHHFETVTFVSAVKYHQRKGTFGTGVYLGDMIQMAKEARIERDAIIDSCLVRIRELGVKTDTLRFSPQLPIRMGQALKGTAEQLGLEPSALREVLMADTL